MIKIENGKVGGYPVWGDKEARETLQPELRAWVEDIIVRRKSGDLVPTHPFEFVGENPWETPSGLEGFEVRPFRGYGPVGKSGRENLEVVLFEVSDGEEHIAVAINTSNLISKG